MRVPKTHKSSHELMDPDTLGSIRYSHSDALQKVDSLEIVLFILVDFDSWMLLDS